MEYLGSSETVTMASLQSSYKGFPEAGCDEAGRGCLAGPVFAAAVILPKDYFHPLLNDSKQITEKQRNLLRREIEENSIAYAVAQVDAPEIDQINILWASVRAMHLALDRLTTTPGFILVDGNRFRNYKDIPHQCFVGGDALYTSISAASILAKTYRDEHMQVLHESYPHYEWSQNKGYPTQAHRKAIQENGICEYHRKSFQLMPPHIQGELPFPKD